MPRDRHGEKEKKKRRKRDLPKHNNIGTDGLFFLFQQKNSGTGFPKIYKVGGLMLVTSVMRYRPPIAS